MTVVVVDKPQFFIVVFAAPLDGLGDVPFGGDFSLSLIPISERFGHIVVRSQFQPLDAVFRLGLGCQEDDGNVLGLSLIHIFFREMSWLLISQDAV